MAKIRTAPHRLSRRGFVGGLGAAGATVVMANELPSNPDVVIIGAGSAGLAAGREFAKAGVSFVILEAANRVGGRAWTENDSLGQPFDHGCSWISGANVNPYSDIAKTGGFSLVDHTHAGSNLFDAQGQPANLDESRAYDRAWGAIERGLSRAGRAGKDVAAATVVPDVPYGATVQSWIGPMDHGVDFSQLSTMDWWESAASQPSFLVKEGLGAVVATLAHDLPVSLNTRVTAIHYGDAGVRIDTLKGTLSAKACVVTVSTGVLNAGSIRFDPALPDWKQQAISDIPMGLLMKVPLLFDGTRLGLGENNWVTHRVPEDQAGQACFFVAWPCGHDYLVGFLGGQFAWDLYAQGQEAVVDYALEQVVRIVGTNARKHFVKGFATSWADNPLTMGAYGAAKPGAYEAREMLGRPIADKLFFAGEAMAGARSALVNGAYLSGQSTANQIIDMIG